MSLYIYLRARRMSLYIYLRELRQLGAVLTVEAGELRISAPEGLLDSETLDYLRSHRGSVLETPERYREGFERIGKAREAAYADPALAWGGAVEETDELAEIQARFEDAFVEYCDGQRDFASLKPIWKEELDCRRRAKASPPTPSTPSPDQNATPA